MIIESFFHISVFWIIEWKCYDPKVFLFSQDPEKEIVLEIKNPTLWDYPSNSCFMNAGTV